jgi:predicted dienelactone hydrolase
VIIVILFFLIVACIRPNSSPAAGLRTIAITTPEREAPISVSLWYPTSAGGSPTVVGGNPVFKGIAVQQDAAIAKGEFPLILLAHGGLRAAPHLSGWIASYLATRGFIVAEPQPPQLGPADAQAALAEVWLRPADLSATLQAIESDAGWNAHLQKDRIGVVGFLLGGTSALMLAGAELDPVGYATMCDGEAAISMDCSWFAANGVDLHDVALNRLEHANDRIKVAIAIDPELSAVFTQASLNELAIPVTIINLGTPATILPALNAASLARLIPEVTYETVTDATHYSAFSECTAKGAQILQAEGDDTALCTDGSARPRAEIHRQVAEMIESAFVQKLSNH